ncbi:MAG: hypothetical protein ABI999_00790 [Acidobacteriota bacterium]
MFCPNCGKEDQTDQKFCRSCGLKLDAVSLVVADQFPSVEYAAFQRRRHMFERLGHGALAISGLTALMLLIFAAALYKLILLGPEILFGSAIVALVVFLLLSVVLIGYSRLFVRFEKVDRQPAPLDESIPTQTTGKLLQDRFFEPVPSVTEHSTDLLPRSDKRHRD